MKNEIKTIQYLRGIAALAVVLFHFKWILNEPNQLNINNLGDILFSNGGFGVDLFFIISGFVIVLSTEKNIGKRNNFISFLLKRIFRIYPLLFLFITLVSIRDGFNIIPLIKSLLPLHLDYNSMPPYFGYNVLIVAWTLTFEIFFYLLFSASMFINHKYRGLISILLISFLFISSQYFAFGTITLDAHFSKPMSFNFIIKAPLSLMSSPMMLEFCLGIISYYIYKHLDISKSINASVVKTFTACAGLLFFVILVSSNYFSGHGVTKWGFIAFLMLTTIVIYEKNFTIKESNILKSLGDTSYSIYMSHLVLISIVIFANKSIGLSGFSFLIFSVTSVIIASSITFNYIEKPMSHVCKKAIDLIVK